MTSQRASAALAFLGALDKNDAEGLLPWIAPQATWWVDTGRDRASGIHGVDPGPDRPWPLHGTMDMLEKVDLLRGLPERFPGGCRQVVWHSVAGGDHVMAEVNGDGVFHNGKRYQNRYAFVFSFEGDRISEVREYLDTQHAADVFGGRHLDRRSAAPMYSGSVAEASDDAQERAVALVSTVAAADPDMALPLFADGATWWADSGTKRERAAHDLPIDHAPRNPMYGKVPVSIRVPLIGGLSSMFAAHWTLWPTRMFSGSNHVVMEVTSDGEAADGRRYQNRYCFVLTMQDGRIGAVREYCDTLHAFDIMGAR